MRISDWSADVCSSDLVAGRSRRRRQGPGAAHGALAAEHGRYQAAGRRRRCTGGGLDPRAHERHGRTHRHQHGLVAEAWRMIKSEEHTSELPSLMRISYAVFCLKKKKTHHTNIKS